MATNHATLELPNNFISPTQMINGFQIPAIKYGNLPSPQEKPSFKGQLYFANVNDEGYLWLASGTASISDWQPLVATDAYGDVATNKSNHFTDSLQTIIGKQITTVHVVTTETPTGVPNFEHQLCVSSFGGKYTLFLGYGGKWNKLTSDNGTIDTTKLAKLDVSNDFTQVQSVKGNAIVSIINGTHADPNGNVTADYPGQMYLYEDASTSKTDYYIADASGSWDMINEEMNTANFVKNNIANNFERTEQKIANKQIVTVIAQNGSPNIQPNFVGQIYLDTSADTGNVFLATSRTATPDSANWVCLNMPGGLPNDVVLESIGNDFTVQNQKINGYQLMTVVESSTAPPQADSSHVGRFFVQKDGTKITPYMCVSTGGTSYEYKPITATIGSEYVRKDKVNNFVATNDQSEKEGQLIHGRPILCSVVRDDTPDVSNIRPEFKGQLYIYRKRIASTTEYDTALWIADDNNGTSLQWTPLQRDLRNLFVQKGTENTFTKVVQKMQKDNDVNTLEYIMGAKKINGLPTSLVPSRIGETIISEMTNQPPTPSIFRIYVAIGATANDWLEIYNSSNNFSELEARTTDLEGHRTAHHDRITALESNSGGGGSAFNPSTNYTITGNRTWKGNNIIEKDGDALRIRPVTNNAASYLSFAKDRSTRSAYFGYSSSSSNVLAIANEKSNADINLITVGTGKVKVNNVEVATKDLVTTVSDKADSNLARLIIAENKTEVVDQKIIKVENDHKNFGPRLTTLEGNVSGYDSRITANHDKINQEASKIANNKTSITTLENSAFHSVELDTTNSKFVFKNKGGDVALELAIPSFPNATPVASVDVVATKEFRHPETINLGAKVLPTDSLIQHIRYTSSDTSVATVDNKTGDVTTVAVGTCKITCNSLQGNKTAECNVTVVPIRQTHTIRLNEVKRGNDDLLFRDFACGDRRVSVPANKMIHKLAWAAGSTATNPINGAMIFVVDKNTNTIIDKLTVNLTVAPMADYIGYTKKYTTGVLNKVYDVPTYFCCRSNSTNNTHKIIRLKDPGYANGVDSCIFDYVIAENIGQTIPQAQFGCNERTFIEVECEV
ncbi:MAG: Ig-like domain-containing protein [Clostridium sp.]|uniref:Ig-like domain-containing protein n=1 Tax=Clostridium sp. TaxID=1506 RepID=UPI003F2F373F